MEAYKEWSSDIQEIGTGLNDGCLSHERHLLLSDVVDTLFQGWLPTIQFDYLD